MLDSFVKSYVQATYTSVINFPVDKNGVPHICCVHCPLYNRKYNICTKTDEYILQADKFVGYNCPLKIEEE